MAKKKHKAHSHSGSPVRHHDHQSTILLLAGGLVVLFCLLLLGGARFFMPMQSFAPSSQVMHPTEKSMMPGTNMMQDETGSPSQDVAQETVTINNYSFYPDTVTVKAGTAVIFDNKDSVAHTATVYPSLDTGNIEPGANKTIVFKTPGTYHYKCLYHPQMTGTVIVE